LRRGDIVADLLLLEILIKLRAIITVRKGQSSRSVGKVTLPELLSEQTLTVRPDLHCVEFLKTMALSTGQSYSQALQYANRQNMHTSADMSNRQEFTRETEVTAKLPQKRTRQCIYDLLTKIKFPIGCSAFYITCGGERVLVVIRFNVTYLPLRPYCEKLCTSFLNAESLTESVTMVARFVAVRLFIFVLILSALPPHFTS